VAQSWAYFCRKLASRNGDRNGEAVPIFG
jgi:hypothetical protein